MNNLPLKVQIIIHDYEAPISRCRMGDPKILYALAMYDNPMLVRFPFIYPDNSIMYKVKDEIIKLSKLINSNDGSNQMVQIDKRVHIKTDKIYCSVTDLVENMFEFQFEEEVKYV